MFHELKKQASFFFKEKIKNARLVLTDVTPAQLLTEEATNGNPWAPDTRTLSSISKAAFELDDYTRIVEILHKRFTKFEKKEWRVSYNSLMVLENLLTHGPKSVAAEFELDKVVIEQMGGFQYIDEKRFNWGLTVRKKSARILKLLNQGSLLKEERDRARKITRGIQGFGSFCQITSSAAQDVLRESTLETYGRSNSDFIHHEDEENQLPSSKSEIVPKKVGESKPNKDSVMSRAYFSAMHSCGLSSSLKLSQPTSHERLARTTERTKGEELRKEELVLLKESFTRVLDSLLPIFLPIFQMGGVVTYL